MAAIRVWILGLALGCFAAGMIVGHSWSGQAAAGADEASPELRYAEQLIARYQLDAAQARLLRIVLQSDRAEEDAIRKAVDWTQLPPPLQSRLLASRALTNRRIRQLLDERQRAAYDQDSQPSPAAANRTTPR